MGIFSSLFGKKLFDLSANDKRARQLRVPTCEPCGCFENGARLQSAALKLHRDAQDKSGEAWNLLEKLIDEAASKRAKEFAPGLVMPPELWKQIVILPKSIAKLTSVKRLYLYASNLVRIPPEIGKLQNLEELDIYTSYRLHWLPYEITHCQNLQRSRASTRALYGNYKYRSPFPRLGNDQIENSFDSDWCSVCGQQSASGQFQQAWISLRVATDVFPLLVHACSEDCISKLPKPPNGYVDHPHKGGLDVKQPEAGL